MTMRARQKKQGCCWLVVARAGGPEQLRKAVRQVRTGPRQSRLMQPAVATEQPIVSRRRRACTVTGSRCRSIRFRRCSSTNSRHPSSGFRHRTSQGRSPASRRNSFDRNWSPHRCNSIRFPPGMSRNSRRLRWHFCRHMLLHPPSPRLRRSQDRAARAWCK